MFLPFDIILKERISIKKRVEGNSHVTIGKGRCYTVFSFKIIKFCISIIKWLLIYLFLFVCKNIY